MKELEFIFSLERSNRQTGRTTALAKACQEIGGIFIVSNESQKIDLKKKFPDLDIRSLSERNLVGSNKPMILDHYTWETCIAHYTVEATQMRAKINEYRRELLKIKKTINDINLEI